MTCFLWLDKLLTEFFKVLYCSRVTTFTNVMASNSDQESKCHFCRRGLEVRGTCGRLWVEKGIVAHRKCMQYSADLIQYNFDTFGGFEIPKVMDEIKRGQQLSCCKCKHKKKSKMRGSASCGCAIKKCKKSFHFYCAKTSDKAITKRLEVTNSENEKEVWYRVFCNVKHQHTFKETILNEMDYSYMSDSDPDGDSVDEWDFAPQSSYEDSVPIAPAIPKPKPMPHSTAKGSSALSQSSDNLLTDDKKSH